MDWVVAILLGIILVALAFALPILVTFLSVLLTPALFLLAAILVIWFLLQILKDGSDDPRNGRGPGS